MRMIGWFRVSLLPAALCATAWLVGAQSEWLPRLKNYTFGKSVLAWTQVDKSLRSSIARERKAAEELMVEVLLARGATRDSRMMACRRLRFAAQEESYVALISLLKEPRLSTEARMALEAKRSAEIDAALRGSLPLVSDPLKSGFLSSIVLRGDQTATADIAAIVRSTRSTALRLQAIRALGQLGGEEALEELRKIERDIASRRQWMLARLSAARRTLEMRKDRHPPAVATLEELLSPEAPKAIRIGALVELARHDPERRENALRLAFSDDGTSLFEAAPSLLEMLADNQRLALYGASFDTLSPKAQALLVNHWRPGDGHEDRWRELSIDTAVDPELREAATRALDRAR